MEISDPIRIRMTVHGFWPTVYIRRMYGLNRICAVYGPYLQVVQFDSQQQQSFLLFFSIFFLAPLLTELFLCFPFLLMHVFCIN
jgi:hypothetical protein